MNKFNALKTSSRTEIAEEIKVRFAQSQKAIIQQPLKPTTRENSEINHFDQEVTFSRACSISTNSIRFDNVENVESDSPYTDYCLLYRKHAKQDARYVPGYFPPSI